MADGGSEIYSFTQQTESIQEFFVFVESVNLFSTILTDTVAPMTAIKLGRTGFVNIF